LRPCKQGTIILRRTFISRGKASKFITHWKRLSDKCENSIALMDSRLRVLEQKISVVLFQLPPNFLEDAERLAMLPRCYRYAFEFRHRSWYVDRVLTILQEANVALCFSDHADAPAPWETTAGHIYMRGHGPSGRYHGTYPAPTLRRWADAALRWRSEKRKVYIFFDNDQKAAAPKDVARLAAIVGVQRPSRPDECCRKCGGGGAARPGEVGQVLMTKDQAGRLVANSTKLPKCSVDNAQVIADE
jgi:uncharacterized protein YecE (DUF72 family)